MKRRVLCLIISLALCLNLCPVWAADEGNGTATHKLYEDLININPYEVSGSIKVDTNGFAIKGASPAVLVTGTGNLYFTGTVITEKGAGIEIQSGGALTVTGESSVTGATYALDIASGAEVKLSGGRYSGANRAIQAADGDFAAMLEEGYAFYDKNGNPLSPADAAKAKALVVGECAGHSEHSWTHTPGSTEHAWTCPYCGVKETETCSFSFGQDGGGTCDTCGRGISIVVDRGDLADLVYDSTMKLENVSTAVTLTDGSGKVLVKDTDYEVDYEPQRDAGEVTVTVTGITFGGTFTKTYNVEQDKPGIRWDADTCAVDYDDMGLPVDSAGLPHITITIKAPNQEDLHPYLQYSYRKSGETEFTDGLPTNAGTYEVRAYLEESQNYTAAETGLLTLTINKIPAVATAPAAKTLEYNREAQELVTSGALKPGAAAEGLNIEFKAGTDGAYSTDIPTGVSVSDYNVYYRVSGTENYSGVSETLVKNPDTKYPSARINHREIKPAIELEYYTTQYTGGDKEPAVTVKDGEYIIPKSEYEVAYTNNKNVGTATVTVTNKQNGNYKLTTATATFKITNQPQAALTITQKPNSVTYGDLFTLGTSGGSGSGDVTWKITAGTDVAEVDEASGQVTVIGDGSFTVQATKSGKDPADAGITNYDNATASWTVTAAKKPVTATVTAENKSYGEIYDEGDELNVARVNAVVELGVLPGDVIEISGLTGTFSDGNAGVGKTVTVDATGAVITGKNSQHYAVSYSSTSVKATINKAVVHITTAPDAAELTYSGEAQGLIVDSVLVIDTKGVSVEYSLSKDGPYDTAIPQGTNAGTYIVWYRVQDTDNYTGLAPASVDVTIAPKPVTPTVTLSGDGLTVEEDGSYSCIFDGNAKEPLVTLYEADGTTLIPADQYSVDYSNNINVGTTATVTVTARADGNYTFTNAPVTAAFEIKKEQAKVITAPEAAGDPLTFRNSDQKLVTAGTASGGKMVYSTDGGATYSDQIPTKIKADKYTVHYKVEGDGNHSDSDVGYVDVTIAPKTVKDPTIELLDDDGKALVSYTYDGSRKEPKVIVKDGSTVIDGDEYNVVYSNNTDAGNGLVNITDKTGGDYTVTGSATFVIVKADIVDPAPSAAAITYDGKPHELLVPGTTSGGEVLYALNSQTSTYTAAIPTATEAGNYTVYYKVTGDKNHNDLAVRSVPVTIQRKELTAVTIELSPGSFAYDGTTKMPTVTVKDGKTVLPEEEYSWSCSVVSPTTAGEYTITVSDKDGGNYDLSKLVPPANEATFSIGQIAQKELVIGGKPPATNYGDRFQLTVSGGTGDGAVSWYVTGGPATVDSDGNVTITDVGEVEITVKKAADNNYLEAEAQWTFTAAPMPVTAVIVAADKVFDGTAGTNVTSAGITTINGDSVTIDPASITAAFVTPAVGEGKTVTLDTSEVKVNGAAAGKYAISYPSTVTANITLATASISSAPTKIDGLTYNGQPQPLVTAGQTNVGFIVYSLNENGPFSPEIPTGTNAGTYNVYYKVDGTADYTGAAVNEEPVTVTIASKAITPVIEVTEDSYLYDGTKKNPTITVRDDETVIDKKQYTVTWADEEAQPVTELIDAGTYTATIENVGGGNYKFSAAATVKIVTAEQAALNITGQPGHVYYGDTVTTLGTSGGSGNGTVTWSITAGGTNSTIDTASGKLTVKDTGSITVKAERTVPNYGTVSDTWTFTVEPKPVTAVVTVTPKVYDGTTDIAEGYIKAEVKAEDRVDSADSIGITGLKGDYDNANAGTGKEVLLNRDGVSITADTGKYTVIIPGTATASITPREVTVSVTLSDHDLQTDEDGYFYIYDGSEKRPAVKVTADDNNAELTSTDYNVDYSKNKNVGTADVTVTASVGGNYKFDEKTVKFTITSAAAQLTKSPEAKSLTYTGQAQELVTVGTASGGHIEFLQKDGTYKRDIPTETGAGTYTVTYKVVGDDNFADADGIWTVSVTIRPKEIVSPKVTVSGDYTYDGNPQTPAAGAVEVKDGEAIIPASEYSVLCRDNVEAGTATVIITNANGGNYIVNGTGTFQIGKGDAKVEKAPEGKTSLPYNGGAQELVTAGSASGGTMVYALSEDGEYSPVIPTGTAVDTYTVYYKVQGDGNHRDTGPASVAASIVVNNVEHPTVQLEPGSVTWNGQKQEPTVTVKDDSGMLIDGSEFTVTYADAENSNNDDLTQVGKYTLTITGKADGNYSFTATDTFEILPADQTPLTITGTRERVCYGDTIQLGTSGGSGTITWAVSDGAPASITNGLHRHRRGLRHGHRYQQGRWLQRPNGHMVVLCG